MLYVNKLLLLLLEHNIIRTEESSMYLAFFSVHTGTS